MNRIEEHEVFAAAVGLRLNRERLNVIARHSGSGRGDYADCEEFLVGNMDRLRDTFGRRFGITQALLDGRKHEGMFFQLCLYLCGDKLMGGHIFKYKAGNAGDHLRSTGYAMSPTQQEIRIAGRIVQYLMEENA